MLVGRGPDVTEAELIDEICPDGQRMGDLPVPCFLNEEDVPHIRRVAHADVCVVRIRETSEDRAKAAELLIHSDGVLIRIRGKGRFRI